MDLWLRGAWSTLRRWLQSPVWSTAVIATGATAITFGTTHVALPRPPGALRSEALSPRARTTDAQNFVGASACAPCHAAVYAKWTGGRHSKMIQPATPKSVQGDFTRATVTLNGEQYGLRFRNGAFYVLESALTGRAQEHRVEYTLGSRRIQHYLTRLADGSIIVLPPSWDVAKAQWFHNLDIVRPEEVDRTVVQRWNKNCFGCHVSQEVKNYDAASQKYATEWQDFGTSCERCHGPGGRHAAKYANARSAASLDARTLIVRPTRLDATASSMICAQCHSLRDIAAEGFTAGKDYYDYFLPLLEYGPRRDADPAYWADGRPRRFSNDAIGFWQSGCFLKGGASCVTCHTDPHEPDIDKNPQLDRSDNQLCTRCHNEIGSNLSAHTRHSAASAGSSCVECHMPKEVISIKATMRDHSMSVPAPENTLRFGIPNACTDCHAGKSAQWAIDAMKKWTPLTALRASPGEARGRAIMRAKVFTDARANRTEAIAGLLALARDPAETPIGRANAIGYLRQFADPRVVPALIEALHGDDPAVRVIAAIGLGDQSADVPSQRAALIAALGDPRRVVRMSAAVSLANLGVTRLEGEPGRALADARHDYLLRARFNADDPSSQLNLGTFHLMGGEFDNAAAALRAGLALQPDLPAAKYLLALALIGTNRIDQAIVLLKQVRTSDPYYERARERLKNLRRQ